MISLLRSTGERIFSMQLSKPGQARVFGADGSEYVIGSALRMKTQWRLAVRACSLKDSDMAAVHIEDILNTLDKSAL